jgi:hypothetical protein
VSALVKVRCGQRTAAAVFLFWGVLMPVVAVAKAQDLGLRRMAALAAVDIAFAAAFLAGGGLLLAAPSRGARFVLFAASLFLVLYLGLPVNFLAGYSALALTTVPTAMLLVMASCWEHLQGQELPRREHCPPGKQ